MIKLEKDIKSLERYEAQKTLYIVDRKIRDTSAVNIVIGDSNCKYLEFKMPRFYDGIDLSHKTIQIHYLRSDLKGSENAPVNVDITENDIEFGWIVPPEAASKPGKLLVSIEAFGADYVWRTMPAVFSVGDGIKSGEGIPEPDKNWYEQFLREMDKKMNLAAFATFEIDENGNYVVEVPDHISNITFTTNENGELEVEY